MATTDSPKALSYRPALRVLLSIVIAVPIAIAINTIVSLVASAAGAKGLGLSIGVFAPLTIILVSCAAVGWHLVNRYVRSPQTTFTWLVPTLLGISLIPDVLVGSSGAAGGWAYAVSLMTMHVLSTSAAVLTFLRAMPLRQV